jgi:trans-aconitate 2-methyltransferase
MSAAMLTVARAAAASDGRRPPAFVQASGVALPFRGAFDAVFSAATLHWIQDHQAVFANVAEALRPAGRFIAQCGGRGNLDLLLERAGALMATAPYEPYFRDWAEPWNFADPAVTLARLEQAGFADVDAWLEEAPVDLVSAAAYAEFVSCVCIRHHLDRLPLNLREPFTSELTERAARDSRPFRLDYWRLNVSARTPA